MAPSTGKNVILSLLLSVTLTVIGAFVYFFYPLLGALVTEAFSGPHTVFVVAVGRGDLLPLLLIGSAVFIVIFLLLQKRSVKG